MKRINATNELQLVTHDKYGGIYSPITLSTSNHAASDVSKDFYGKIIKVSIRVQEVKE